MPTFRNYVLRSPSELGDSTTKTYTHASMDRMFEPQVTSSNSGLPVQHHFHNVPKMDAIINRMGHGLEYE